MWHEHTRSDRDMYIEILEENIDPDNHISHFNQRKEFEVKNYGQIYDYGSIMHFGKDYFSNNGKDTLRVADTLEYACQGGPVLGQRSSLSVSDAIKLNQMYNCPGSGYGVPGHLSVHIRHGVALSLKNAYSNMYVQVTAVDDNGKYMTETKYIKQSVEKTELNQWIDFGARMSWQYFVMNLWIQHNRNIQVMSNQTFTVSQGSHRNLQYCDGQSCTSRIIFDYNLDPDCNDCNPNKCIHGTCTDQFFTYRCNCPQGYSGLQCEVIRGVLLVYIRHGHGLLPNDQDHRHASNAYASVIAYNHNGSHTTLTTRKEWNTRDPQWNQWLDFGENSWSRLSVTIYDDNTRKHRWDLLSNTTSYYFPTHDSKEHVRKPCNTGYVELDYYFQP